MILRQEKRRFSEPKTVSAVYFQGTRKRCLSTTQLRGMIFRDSATAKYISWIYLDLDDKTTQSLLTHYEDLDTWILTGNTRGQADDVRTWVTKQRNQVRDPLYVDRPDEECTGLSVLQDIFGTLRAPEQARERSSRTQEAELLSRL